VSCAATTCRSSCPRARSNACITSSPTATARWGAMSSCVRCSAGARCRMPNLRRSCCVRGVRSGTTGRSSVRSARCRASGFAGRPTSR
jgi:hypothetical protein